MVIAPFTITPLASPAVSGAVVRNLSSPRASCVGMEWLSVLFGRTGYIACAVLAALTLSGAPAAAQGGIFGFFENNAQRGGGWFGRQRQYVPQQASPYADPSQNGSDRYGTSFGSHSYGDRQASAPSSGGGRGVAFCVRLCDGRYFPIQRHANATPVQLCSAFCPATKTAVFNGSQIDHAIASNGARYADLDNAFVYRQKVVDNCTCNGKDSFGLARIDVAADPTLRQGDIVATGDNVKAALIAMQAAKERARDSSRPVAAAAPAQNGRRTATIAPVPPASAVPASAPTPQEATDDIPED
jgi:hypothetical protein